MSEEIELKDENKVNLEFTIKLKNQLNLKIIKKQIIREFYDNLDQVEEDVLEVINSYLKNSWIDSFIFNEYQILVETLFQESKNILKEKFKNLNEKLD